MSNTPKAPWLNSKDPEVPASLTYSEKTMASRVEEIVDRYPNFTALEFMGRTISYKEMWENICSCAKSLKACGVREGDNITICLPNCPQAVYMFYASNLIGAIANMVHPLSAESEIAFYLRDSSSVAAITLDQFYPKFETVRKAVELPMLIITSISDELPAMKSIGYSVFQNRKAPKIPHNKMGVILWKEFLRRGEHLEIFRVPRKKDDPAVVLYSGGTTGINKGILLSNMNFSAIGTQIIATNPFFHPGHKMLAIMPMFHGFGLGVSIHAMLTSGGECILIPRFTAKTFAQLIKKYKPNLIAGVPSLFESLIRNEEMDRVDLSSLIGIFSGGDSLSPELKKRLDAFLRDHGCKVTVREGYGATECVTASCLTPIHKQKEGSIGIPFPDTYFGIFNTESNKELPYGQEGEICMTGPSVMMGYVNQPEETANALRVHSDGNTWLHTGDLGVMDEDGFIYFRQRMKRMIITNGYNVYPSQLENILNGHEYVQSSCIIGIPDPIKQQKVKAFVVLKPGYTPTTSCKEVLLEYCRKHIAKYALPYDIEFRTELPLTKVGKIAYHELEEEEKKKMAERQAAILEVEAIQKASGRK